jgi:hypothetical protein
MCSATLIAPGPAGFGAAELAVPDDLWPVAQSGGERLYSWRKTTPPEAGGGPARGDGIPGAPGNKSPARPFPVG